MPEIDPVSQDSAAAPMFKVLLLNDDETPMEFVVRVLETVFGKTWEEATKLMLQTHHDGAGVCGVYSAEAAGRLVKQVMAEADKFRHPLKCTMERD
jgi:ATP-dependent Clp protease adaptor protein ClpS